ncbi:hypothetical protein [Mucilaginibacter dorajii]|uniref:Uncharacterized protein n=1 Tax=Mucilaginibacter dorajii TaxID=692994 RepID=A0ABP7PXK2_9SPHI|nr:hypothetical protein [Mucilaginibacter dorajii]MCS3737249.1 hypothetical protein [Mucilaginibacter dorajii]
MDVKLIPVLEINCWDADVLSPGNGPYWLYPEEYNHYNNACRLKAGFEDEFVFYMKGATFVRINDITISNLEKLIKDEVKGILSGEHSREDGGYLSGGYVLNIDGKDVSFPQCCSDLAGINYWKRMARESQAGYDDGHPAPVLTFTDDEVLFDFKAGEIGEKFTPPPLYDKIIIKKADLKKAVDEVEIELYKFAERIEGINKSLSLNIINIDKLLIWGDD